MITDTMNSTATIMIQIDQSGPSWGGPGRIENSPGTIKTSLAHSAVHNAHQWQLPCSLRP